MGTKVDWKNVDHPAPKWYRRFANAYIIFFTPALTGLAQGLRMSDETRNVWMLILVAMPFFLKGIGMMLGNGEVYADISQVKKTELAAPSEVKEMDKTKTE